MKLDRRNGYCYGIDLLDTYRDSVDRRLWEFKVWRGDELVEHFVTSSMTLADYIPLRMAIQDTGNLRLEFKELG